MLLSDQSSKKVRGAREAASEGSESRAAIAVGRLQGCTAEERLSVGGGGLGVKQDRSLISPRVEISV